MKFLWYIAAHERIEVTSMCYRGLHRVNDYARKQGHEVDVFIVCSDRVHQELAAAHGFYFSNIIPNQPLGRKMNLGLVEAMELDFDYIVQSAQITYTLPTYSPSMLIRLSSQDLSSLD